MNKKEQNYFEKGDYWKIKCLEDLPGEVWKNVPGFVRYEASNLGRVRHKEIEWGYLDGHSAYLKPHIVTQNLDTRDYLTVRLRMEGRCIKKTVNNVVCSAFYGENPNMESNHKNEIKTDNRAENLEWLTRKENNNYGTRNQRIGKSVFYDGVIYEKVKDLADAIGLNQGTLSGYLSGRVPVPEKYAVKGLAYAN